MIMLLGVQVQVRVQGHLSPQIIYCYYFAGSVQSNHQYAHKWKKKYQNLPMHLVFGSFDGSRAS